MLPFFFLTVVSFLSTTTTASFQIYDYLDPLAIQEAWGISDQCLAALNSTIDCDQNNAVKAAQGADNIYWYPENVTALCTSDCASSLSSWHSAVASSCDGQTINYDGTVVLAETEPLMWTTGHDLVCMQDSSQNWCFLESQDWEGSDFVRWDPDVCNNDDPIDNPPQCNDTDFSPASISPDMMSVTRLYDSDLYCSECFIKLWRQRLVSPLLPNSTFTDYLLDQYEDIQSNCSTSLPVTTYSKTLLVSTSAAATTTSGASATSSPAPTATGSCMGQLVDPDPVNLVTCNDVTDKYNVTTGDVRVATNDYYCQFNTTICLPLPCELDTILGSPTCDNLTELYSTTETSIDLTQFLFWNKAIQGSCGFLAIGQRVCKSPPGGHYTPSATFAVPAAAGSYYTTATASEPTQTGSVSACGLYYNVVSGDTCNGICLRLLFALLRSRKDHPLLMALADHRMIMLLAMELLSAAAAQRAVSVEAHPTTVAIAPVILEHAMHQVQPLKMAHVDHLMAEQLAPILNGAHVVQSTAFVETTPTIVEPETAIQEPVKTQTTSLLTDLADLCLQAIRHAQEPNLEVAVRLLGIVGVPVTTAEQGIAIQELVTPVLLLPSVLMGHAGQAQRARMFVMAPSSGLVVRHQGSVGVQVTIVLVPIAIREPVRVREAAIE
ncbi:uncharacterized protein PAC_18453 [Phialocephala subalpina]|uniref:LysM domain-containing protein n=1 Tax=Phialocephala subalpina TaxID=576137 RepID=A0A1L7XU58_9HELO|nr:uncharacterized protein PAC_18453 [Phialocephala subalpina]